MTVLEMRVALTTEHGRGQIFRSGRATLEIFDEGHAAAVDELEVG